MEWQDVKKELLKDLEVKEYYEQLGPSYQVIRQVITERRRLNLTQQEFAKRLGTTQSVVARIESGEANLTLQTLERISEALNCQLQISLTSSTKQQINRPVLKKAVSSVK